MQRAYLHWVAWGAILALAIWLRMDGLSERPVHADEATGARILAERIEGNGYNYDPTHFHGPTLSLFSQPVAILRGEDDWHSLSANTLRLATVIAGVLTILTPLLWSNIIGKLPSLIAAALLATSPILVYYNRMYIHESWLVLFGLLSMYAIYRILSRPTLGNGIVAGVFVGLMFATKVTFAISIISWSVAAAIYLSVLFYSTDKQLPLKTYWKPFVAGIFTSILVGAVIFTNGFTQLEAFPEAIQSFFIYETTLGHEKPFYYFLELLIWPKHSLGVWWTEIFIGLLTIVAIVINIKRNVGLPLLLFVIISSITHFLIYSCIAYKTPWLILLTWAHVCLLAAFAFRTFELESFLFKSVMIPLLVIGLGFQIKQSVFATGNFSNDTRNPYAYVPTSKDIQRLQPWLLELDKIVQLEPIAVIGHGYWPLPWYIKDFEKIGYWSEVSSEMRELPLVISMESEAESCSEALKTTHTSLPRSLRENVSMTLFLRNDLWQKWTEATP